MDTSFRPARECKSRVVLFWVSLSTQVMDFSAVPEDSAVPKTATCRRVQKTCMVVLLTRYACNKSMERRCEATIHQTQRIVSDACAPDP